MVSELVDAQDKLIKAYEAAIETKDRLIQAQADVIESLKKIVGLHEQLKVLLNYKRSLEQ